VLTDLLQWPTAALIALASVPVLLIVLVALLVAVQRASRERAEAERRLKENAEQAARRYRRLDQDHNFLVDFFRIFSRLVGDMHAERQVRMIPDALLDAIVRIYRPEVASVLVRRASASQDDADGPRLSVAALHSTRGILRKGMEFKFGEGQVGIVAERGQVMVRRDFEEDQVAAYASSRVSMEPKYDILAPMIAGGDTLGVLAISRPDRHHDNERDVLEMIARIGALTWKNLQAYREKEVEAEVDKLTRIFNKGALMRRLGLALHEARTTAEKVAVFIFDIDNFKIYNDTNGHLAGDRLLTKLATLVKDTVRADDVFGRFGGEEFLLVMPNRTGAQAMTVAGMIRKRIEEYPFEGGSTQPLGRVTISGGVAIFPDDANGQVELMQGADNALYRAKQSGRNQVFRSEEQGLNPVETRPAATDSYDS
jgi:diguanylate cyclase (GGDEF)-like protein